MLFIKYRKEGSCHAAFLLNIKKKNFFMWSLQAQVKVWLQKRKRALRFGSCEGSVTVETVLALPIFLCASAGLLMLGSLLLTEAKIQYALTKTADVYAAQKAWESLADSGEQRSQTGQKEKSRDTDSENADSLKAVKGMARALLSAASVQTIFSSVYEASPVDSECIYGGRTGIVLSASVEQKDTVRISAVYRMKIEIPFMGTYSFPKKVSVKQRIFNGYSDGESEEDNVFAEGIVYVTEHGSVYHTSLSCSHISLRISGGEVGRILAEKKYHACDKCIDDGEVPSVMYVTKYGDKYHSSLACSGLRRTVKAIPRNEAEGMRMCSRCAAKK